MSLKIVKILEKDRENRLKIDEKSLADHLEDIIAKTDRIMARTTVVAQCVFSPPQVSLDITSPQKQVQVSYLNSSGPRTEVEHADITYSTESDSPPCRSLWSGREGTGVGSS